MSTASVDKQTELLATASREEISSLLDNAIAESEKALTELECELAAESIADNDNIPTIDLNTDDLSPELRAEVMAALQKSAIWPANTNSSDVGAAGAAAGTIHMPTPAIAKGSGIVPIHSFFTFEPTDGDESADHLDSCRLSSLDGQCRCPARPTANGGSFIPFPRKRIFALDLENQFIMEIEKYMSGMKMPRVPTASLRKIARDLLNDYDDTLDIWMDFGGRSEISNPGRSQDCGIEAISELTMDVSNALLEAFSPDEKMLELVSALLTRGAVSGYIILLCSSIGVYLRTADILRQMMELVRSTMVSLRAGGNKSRKLGGNASAQLHPDYRDFSYEIKESNSTDQRDTYFIINVAGNRRIIELTWIPGKPTVQDKQLIITLLRDQLIAANTMLVRERGGSKLISRPRKQFAPPPRPYLGNVDLGEIAARSAAIMESAVTGCDIDETMARHSAAAASAKNKKKAGKANKAGKKQKKAGRRR